MSKPLKKTKLSDLVSKHVRDSIISGEIKSGDRLVETAIAKELGVSQAPVREAFRELSVMGLVKIVPYSGSYVLPITKKKLLHIYSLRTMIESIAAEQSVGNISDEAISRMEKYQEEMNETARIGDAGSFIEYDALFHSEIVKAADNVMLEKMWNLIGATHWSSLTVAVHPDLKMSAESHKEILRLVKKRDSAALTKELKRHFDRAASFILDSMSGEADSPEKTFKGIQGMKKS